jgi:hypothetical protein
MTKMLRCLLLDSRIYALKPSAQLSYATLGRHGGAHLRLGNFPCAQAFRLESRHRYRRGERALFFKFRSELAALAPTAIMGAVIMLL